jgi:Mycothiol maleylpyruvate isomerase N-terminal domain
MSFNPTPQDVANRYGDARSRVIGLVSALPDAQLAVIVPGTPRWTVRELVSHLVGGPVCFLTGSSTADVGSEAWTQAQVDERRDRSIWDLVEEWDGPDAGGLRRDHP